MQQIEQLKQFVQTLAGLQGPNAIGVSPEAFFLRFGAPMIGGSLPEGIRRGPMKNCLQNATDVSLYNGGRYIYCEGYAAGVIPVVHAWCLDIHTGLVADPTWKDAEKSVYFGVPFTRDFVRDNMVRTKFYGITTHYWDPNPVLAAENPGPWLHREAALRASRQEVMA